MDHEHSQNAEHATVPPNDTRPSPLPSSRVTALPEPQRVHGHQGSVVDTQPAPPRFTTSWQYSEESPAVKHNWAAGPSHNLDTLADAAERPEKRIRLDTQSSATSVETVKSATQTSMRQHVSHEADSGYPGSSERTPVMDFDVHRHCDNCWDCDRELASMVNGLIELQAELAKSQAGPRDTASAISHQAPTSVAEVTKYGLKYALSWAASEVGHVLASLQDAPSAATASAWRQPTLPGIASNMGVPPPSMRRLSIHSQTGHVATPRSEAPHVPLPVEHARLDQHHRRPSDPSRDRLHSSYESLPPIIPPDEMKRSLYHEHTAPGSAQSPQTSSGSSIYGPGQSPLQSHGIGRSLPSPPGSHFPNTGLPPLSHPHASPSQAAQASHLQDLQHQISTKTLALQTLQREHDQLLAAFSRSQIRCNTLDKKSQVSDHEINSLSEEKHRLQQQVEALESQVEELSRARDEVQRQSSADGAQWRQIMAMSSQLQTKGAEEARIHKAAQDAWDQEREAMERRIRELEEGSVVGATRQGGAYTAGIGTGTGSEDVITSTSLESLRGEIARLRRRLADSESILRELTGETEQIDRAMRAVASIRARWDDEHNHS